LKGIHLMVGLIMCSCLASAQSIKIRQAIVDGNLKRAFKLAEEAEADPDLKKDPEIYFLKAEVIYELMRDEFYLKKNPESLKIGLKSIERGRSRAGGEIYPEYREMVDRYVILNDLDANLQYRVNRYSQAVTKYLNSYSLNGNRTSYFWAGKCLITSEDTAEGEKIYQEIVFWSNEQHAMEKQVDSALSEVYTYFADKYWRKEKYDSANVYLESARKIFGGDPKLDYYQKEIATQRINKLPPSNLMMEIIKHTLEYFPTDSFFIKKENALALYLMRKNLENGNVITLDTSLARFAAQKVQRGNSKDKEIYKAHDQFIDTKTENVLWKLVAYFGKYEHKEASNYVCDIYIRQTASSDSIIDIQKRYLVIIDYAAKSKSLNLANQILSSAIALYGANAEFNAIQSSLISQNMKKELNRTDLGAMYTMMLRKEPNLTLLSDDFQVLTVKYIDALVKDRYYTSAKKIILTHGLAQPDNPLWNKKLKVLAKEDFYYSYYETRIVEDTVAGMRIPGFEWNGNPLLCEEGTVSDEVQQKVANRINYFRRQAGVPEIYLDEQLNGWCQKAALMMEVNKMMNHSPRANWSCFSDEGAQACKYSLLNKGTNTTLAVTSFFADNKNPSVGNRRWLLYPNGQALGHGSSTNYCALWALDDSGNVDTNLYKDKFVAWPPEGLVPNMMVFNHWSFSVNQDLTGAKIAVTESGNPINIEVMPLVKGYGLPTIVWKLKEELNNLPTDRDITVSVTLKNGRKYTYHVNILNFDPVGY